jgi:hypothetical protein
VPDDEQKTDEKQPAAGSDPTTGTGDDGSAHESGQTGGEGEDKFRPEAIAARVDRIGEETELDRVANEEEKKLLERKKSQKKRGLEAAASKRLAKIGESAVKRPSALGAVNPDADPLLEQAARASTWIKEHRQTFGGIAAVGLLAIAGFGGWSYWQDKRNGQASALLAQALSDQHGYVSDKEPDDDDDTTKPAHLYPTFKSAAERRDAALAKYRDVQSKYRGTGAAILAQLAEGSLLLDAGDSKGATDAYWAVKESALGKADGQVRGRAFEGLGFADELDAKSDPANKDKHLNEALQEFQFLENVDVNGFKELGLYHQARVEEAMGDKAKAIDLLKDVQKRVSDPGQTHPFSYLEFVVEDRLRELDPSALPPKAPKSMGGGPGGAGRAMGAGPGGLDMNDPQVQKLIEQLKQRKNGAPGMMPPQGLPPMPPPQGAAPGQAPAQEAPAPGQPPPEAPT